MTQSTTMTAMKPNNRTKGEGQYAVWLCEDMRPDAPPSEPLISGLLEPVFEPVTGCTGVSAMVVIVFYAVYESNRHVNLSS